MAEFRTMVITNKGQALIAKMLAGKGNIEFTKISLSETTYSDSQLLGLTTISGVKQSTSVSKITKTSEAAIQVEGAVTNATLTSGYYIRTIALHAKDPDEGEIVYAACGASTPGWMPPFNGISTSGAFLKLITTVQNASNVSINVDPAAVATIGDIKDLQAQITDLQAFIGYTDTDIYGVEVDLKNSKFTRLSAATAMTPGNDFDKVNAFGGRKRCILTDNGIVLAYYGEAGYTETGKLIQQIIKDEVTYPVGTMVQVMVEQPKFYYKVVPLQLDKIEGGKGFHMRKIRYYISDTKKVGFKVHPAFVQNGIEKNYIYLSAYEGCLFDTSAGNYILNNDQVYESGDKLSSIGNAKPASSLTQSLNRINCRALAVARGAGWKQQTVQSTSVTQMLFLIEYAMFNMQTAIGSGVTNKTNDFDDDPINMSELTGGTTSLGNKTGSVMNSNGFYPVSYRGEENFFGNIWKWVDGININCKRIHEAYIAEDNYDDAKLDGNYKNVGFTLCKKNGYVSAFGYNEEFDWLFMTSEVKGNSSLPVGDYFHQYNAHNEIKVASFGAAWYDGDKAGGFCWNVRSSASNRHGDVGARLLYVPQ